MQQQCDLILCPPTEFPAMKKVCTNSTCNSKKLNIFISLSQTTHGKWTTQQAIHCYVWNLLDFPAGVVPITKVTEEDEQAFVEATENETDLVRPDLNTYHLTCQFS